MSSKQREHTGIYHLMSLTAAVIWGVTFVSTKILLSNGLHPAEIFFYRFALAYLGLWLWKPRLYLPKNLKDELLFVLAGVSGGSLYFLSENTALELSFASNVALLVGSAPILTVLLSKLWLKNERIGKSLLWGSLTAFVGVALVVFNGKFILKLHPLGDILALLAALSWAFYNIVLKWLDGRYSTRDISRKVFFYGTLTILPAFLSSPLTTDPAILTRPVVLFNLIFLGLIASLVCFLMWNKAVRHLGTVVTSNYIYLMPLVTVLSSAVVLHEQITAVAISGAALILGGVYIAEHGSKKNKTTKNR